MVVAGLSSHISAPRIPRRRNHSVEAASLTWHWAQRWEGIGVGLERFVFDAACWVRINSNLKLESGLSYLHECRSSPAKINRSEESPRFSFFVPLLPAVCNDAPFWVEIPAKLAAKLVFKCCQEHCNRVVPWCRSHLLVALIVN